MPIQPSFSLENRTCTWKRGHGRHWYVRKKFPFCLHAISALYKPITIFFCIIKPFWIFDMCLNFWYVLDVNKNKFYYNIWFYLIIKRLYLWLFLWSGSICPIISRILSCIFEGNGITSQMKGYFSVLLFSILLCHCCL